MSEVSPSVNAETCFVSCMFKWLLLALLAWELRRPCTMSLRSKKQHGVGSKRKFGFCVFNSKTSDSGGKHPMLFVHARFAQFCQTKYNSTWMILVYFCACCEKKHRREKEADTATPETGLVFFSSPNSRCTNFRGLVCPCFGHRSPMRSTCTTTLSSPWW